LGDIEYEGSGLLASTVRIPAGDITPWSPASPQLYELSLELIDDEAPAMLDDLITRVGFREVKVKGKKLLLNGEEFKLCGYNRHEDHPQFGCAIPLEAMIHDLELIRASGANFVRTCHYPNDQRFLDCCDELGICIWEENHARDVPFDQPAFDEQIEQSTREMVHWHFNHPSIIIWGCLNECDSVSKPGRKVHEHCLGLLKELDGSRPVTFASNKQVEDICLDLVDIVSWNLYPGWYGGSIESVEDRFKELYQWLQSPKSGAKGKPLIMSEFGGGAIYGNHDRNRPKWSEEFQADLLDECLRIYLAHPGIIGSAIWQFCDCRVTEGWSMRRPNTINNKGVVDRYRRPKLSFERVTARFQEARERWGV
jgi:beta-glucuronidase